MQNLNKINFIICLFLLTTNFACKDKSKIDKQKTYRVKLAFEPDFYNESGIDTVVFSKPKQDTTVKVSNGDSLNNFIIHQFFKVEGGIITISAISTYERVYEKTLNINSDTTIIFYKKDFTRIFERKEKWSKEFKLKKVDTIVVISSNGSCWTTEEFASFRKISIFKNDTDYLVKYTNLPRGSADIKSNYKTKHLDTKFISALSNFYYSAKRISEIKQTTFCTANAFLTVRIDNNIFGITQPYLFSKDNPKFFLGELYDDLIKSINGS